MSPRTSKCIRESKSHTRNSSTIAKYSAEWWFPASLLSFSVVCNILKSCSPYLRHNSLSTSLLGRIALPLIESFPSTAFFSHEMSPANAPSVKITITHKSLASKGIFTSPSGKELTQFGTIKTFHYTRQPLNSILHWEYLWNSTTYCIEPSKRNYLHSRDEFTISFSTSRNN